MQVQEEETFSPAASELYSKTIERYKEHLSANPCLRLKEFCRESHVNYSGALHWSRRNGISINKLRESARTWHVTKPSSEAFVQFVPSSAGLPVFSSPAEGTVLRDVSITFPDGVNLSMRECTVAGMMNLLDIYMARQASKGGE